MQEDQEDRWPSRRRLQQRQQELNGSSDTAVVDELILDLMEAGDHSWTIARTIGILTMQGGFALLEAGSVRPANKANIMMKNVADMSIGLLLYAAYGYSLTFTSFNAFTGGFSRALLLGAEQEYTHVLHQFSFAATTGTIVSGVLAERVSFKAYVLLSGFIISVLYSLAAHWVWTPEGWLAQLDFVDFAGAGVVHLLGGACALAASAFVGPRIGRFGVLPPLLLKARQLRSSLGRSAIGRNAMDVSTMGRQSVLQSVSQPRGGADRQSQVRWDAGGESSRSKGGGGGGGGGGDGAGTRPTANLRRARIDRAREAEGFRVSDPVNVIYGTFILYVGWINFNCSGTYGLTGGREHLAARVGVVTTVGGAAGTLAGLLYSHAVTFGRAFEIEPASVGALAGLVSVTAACANIGVWEGAFAGFVGGTLACASRGTVLEFLQIDDPVAAIPVHLVGGVWGLMVPGLFNRAGAFGPSTLPGLAHGGGSLLLARQLLGTGAIAGWGLVGTYSFLLILSRILALRVTKEQEKLGLDVVEHGIVPAGGRSERHAPPRLSTRHVVQRLRGRLRGRGRAARSPTQATHAGTSSHATDEFVEDVGHAAKVSAVVKAFARNLAERAATAKEERELARHNNGNSPSARATHSDEASRWGAHADESNEIVISAVGSA